jgi:hypothetical protein
MKQRISELIPGNFQAIPLAYFLRDNKVQFTRPKGYGYLFSDVVITDPRFESETLRIHERSLYA